MNLAVAPTEPVLAIVLPAALDGTLGTNRASGGHRQITADTDVEAVRLWLAEYSASPHTLRSYRKEAIRLLLWATQTLGKPLSSLTREDFLLYERFLAAPTGDWADPDRPRRGRTRRLFEGPLSERSQHQALGILSGLMTYLVSAGYLAGNPLALRRGRTTSAMRSRRVERYLDHALWGHVLLSVEQWPRLTERDEQHYERSRWLIRLLYHTALRVSEAANAKAADFYQRRGKWWLHVIGKGGAEGEVPVGDALMADFARYRAFHGLSPVPAASEVSPAVMSIAGDDARHLTPAAIYLIVRNVFRRAADALDAIDPVGATTLRRASTHWLRHSAASHQADAGTDLRFIQKNLRHASIETTGIYLHAEDDRRHAQTTHVPSAQETNGPPGNRPA
ncbi:tyrosine-type recombinase/integrase [Burkholderia multivorans]|uniref:tyrosine-type recombinase/integrase n=1 Tax=Burkholderia multivorans TaxID=87883 RepID=UPI001C232DBC|nr:tyrosine-type recombinase/integrase [Burkholderia multivorans]MBU9451487.1 tyrosine-type recombinase/integrase [Burkholderia multivorans]MBU9486760.1 tyrosine-type recombinase/integrase [Burkholderia multivorans]MBU9522269.1 tyrosine-type recombinase/integrase [Burkholderia multivorans]MBU9558643.1 tyrosine-type recombinase/integrase [Burkholderia multivorans]